jgi:D-alanyl-D-alanine dipeptidase
MTTTLIALVALAATLVGHVPAVDIGNAGVDRFVAMESGSETPDEYLDGLLRARSAMPQLSDFETFTPDVLVRVPVLEEAYSWDLIDRGLKNGRLPASVLMSVGSCVLERDAAYTMSQMIEAAAADGITLSPAWCYRNLPQQRSTYEANCPLVEQEEPQFDPVTGVPLVDEDGTQLVVVGPPERECTLPTATPSRSNHGWGRAVDFEVRGRTMGCGDAAFRWLQENADDFGWIHPDWAQCNRQTREPWHWEYGGLQLLPFPSLLPPEPIEPPANLE